MTTLGVQNPCRLAAAVALDTGKIIKKLPSVFDRGEDFLQNGKQNFDYRQKSRCKVQHCTRKKVAFFKSIAYSKGQYEVVLLLIILCVPSTHFSVKKL